MGITPAADPSNEEPRFARVRLRRALAGDEGAARSLLAAAAGAAGELAGDEAAARALGDPRDLDAATVARVRVGVAIRLLRAAGLHRAGEPHARALIRLASSTSGTRSLDLGGGLRAERRYGRLGIAGPAPEVADEAVVVAVPGRYQLLGRPVDLLLVPTGHPLPSDALDAERLPRVLVLRNLRPGDRLRTRTGGRKLHDVLIDRKVPRPDRRRLLLLAAGDADAGGGELLWVEGVGASEAVRATPTTGRALVIRTASPSENFGRAAPDEG
jgi:tRNA(Ile)-lysidine synthase